MRNRNKSIGIFDSGVGGLTVMRAIADLLPDESIVYFGDSARAPYGNKSPKNIIRYSMDNALFLMEKNIKYLVVACNTASAFALEKLSELPIPVMGVIDPGVSKVVSCPESKNIAILGTKSTIESGVYQRKLKEALPDANLYLIACPLFVPFIEEGMIDHSATEMIIDEYLSDLEGVVDTVLLGCTHYPLLQDSLQEYFGPDVTILNSASSCAEFVKKDLENLNLTTTKQNQNPSYEFATSDDPDHFNRIGEKFLNSPS